MREKQLRDPAVQRGEPIDLLVDGEPLLAYAGETIAAALTAAGRRVFRHAPGTGEPRGMFCAIGVCFECLVTVEGMGQVRSCMVPVRPGMRVSLGEPSAPTEGDGRAAD
ncbi:MAG: (2Fe-2S)-binding protein [Chloroflexota bacterium]